MPTLTKITKSESPDNHGFIRVASEIYFTQKDMRKNLWFDYPNFLDPFVELSGDSWLIALLPCAFLEQENLIINAPTDPVLLRNAKGLLKIWRAWYADFSADIDVQAHLSHALELPQKRDTIIFFSGGVDSHFSLLRKMALIAHTNADAEIYLVTVWGFDIPLSNSEGFELARQIAVSAALRYNTKQFEVITNLREFPALLFNDKWYAQLSHGAALASVGQLFSKGIKEVIIGSTYDFAHLSPWGSHPLTDPLFGTSRTAILHDGAECTRVEKTDFILSSPDVADRLRVCWGAYGNCSNCSKCLRTMVTIDLAGMKDNCGSFDFSGYSLEQVSRVYLEKEKDAIYFQEIYDAAISRGRIDIADAVGRSLQSSTLKRKWKLPQIAEAIFRALSSMPVVWRYSTDIKRRLTDW